MKNEDSKTEQPCTIQNVICNLCEGKGWVVKIEANCCGNYKDYGCCGIPEPIQVQVECECDRGFVPLDCI
jgi:hypothetical protein